MYYRLPILNMGGEDNEKNTMAKFYNDIHADFGGVIIVAANKLDINSLCWGNRTSNRNKVC